MARLLRRTSVLSLLLLAGLACRSTPEPDLDGVPAGAERLLLGRTRGDQLDCGMGDCQDWFSLRIDKQGRAFVEVRAAPSAPSFEVRALGRSRVLASGRGSGAEPVRIDWATAPGDYQLVLIAEVPPRPGFFARLFGAPRPAPWTYTLASREEIKVATPEPPRFRTVRFELLEVENASEILFEAGTRDGVKPGDQGRLMNGKQEIGQVDIVAVYAGGSRARLRSGRAELITPETQVEIRIPERR